MEEVTIRLSDVVAIIAMNFRELDGCSLALALPFSVQTWWPGATASVVQTKKRENNIFPFRCHAHPTGSMSLLPELELMAGSK